MKLSKYNKLYRRMLFLVFLVFGLLTILFLFMLFVLIRWFDFASVRQNTAIIIFCGVVSLSMVAQVATIFWSRRVTAPLAEISEAVDSIAKGDFEIQLEGGKFKDEIKTLAENINKMVNELKSIEVMRSDFVSNVSHEFKAPLATIQGYVSLLSDKNLPEDTREECYQLLAESTGQLSGLVDNILKLSRLESQNIIAQSKPFSLDEQLRRSVLIFENQWSEKNLYLELDLPQCECVGNADLLFQMWTNLVGNAIKFTDNGGKVGISLTDGEKYAVVKIYDNGIGMTEEVKRHIFEKFYQGDSSHKAQGNGLGLALVKTVAEHYGCDISVESEPDKGTTFTVTVPKVM